MRAARPARIPRKAAVIAAPARPRLRKRDELPQERARLRRVEARALGESAELHQHVPEPVLGVLLLAQGLRELLAGNQPFTKQDFAERMKDRKYVTLIPKGQKAPKSIR